MTDSSDSVPIDWQARTLALEAQLDAVRESRGNHPACDRHSDGGPVTCGWKRAVLGIDAVLASAPSDVLDRVKREAAAEALEGAALYCWHVDPWEFRDQIRARAATIRTGAAK